VAQSIRIGGLWVTLAIFQQLPAALKGFPRRIREFSSTFGLGKPGQGHSPISTKSAF